MEQLLTYLLVAGLAFWAGMKLSGIWNQIVFRELLKDLGVTEQQMRKVVLDHGMTLKDPEDDPEESTLETIEVKLEQHQGQIYAFRTDNDQFLGQGKDREDLVDHLAKNLVNVRLIIREENGAKLMTQES
jgi:hypothetical protein